MQMKVQNEDLLGKHRTQGGESGVLIERKRRPFSKAQKDKNVD